MTPAPGVKRVKVGMRGSAHETALQGTDGEWWASGCPVAPPSPTREVLVMSLLSGDCGSDRVWPSRSVSSRSYFLIALAIGWSRVGTVASGQGAYADTANWANAAAAAAYNMRISQART